MRGFQMGVEHRLATAERVHAGVGHVSLHHGHGDVSTVGRSRKERSGGEHAQPAPSATAAATRRCVIAATIAQAHKAPAKTTTNPSSGTPPTDTHAADGASTCE